MIKVIRYILKGKDDVLNINKNNNNKIYIIDYLNEGEI